MDRWDFCSWHQDRNCLWLFFSYRDNAIQRSKISPRKTTSWSLFSNACNMRKKSASLPQASSICASAMIIMMTHIETVRRAGHLNRFYNKISAFIEAGKKINIPDFLHIRTNDKKRTYAKWKKDDKIYQILISNPRYNRAVTFAFYPIFNNEQRYFYSRSGIG